MNYNFENISLEKGMYGHAGASFSQVLESLDPSENYAGSAFEGLDAYQRQLARFGIRVKGARAATVEKFFENSQTAVLFDEFVARAVAAGIASDASLSAIVAAVSEIDGMDFRGLSIPSAAVAEASEGKELGEAALVLGENVVSLKRYGVSIAASYEALRTQKLDALAVLLGGVGKSLARAYLADAVEALKAGATTFTLGGDFGVAGSLNYDALIDFWNEFDACELNTLLVDRATAAAMLKLDEFQNAAAGLDFQGSGKLITPLGATLIPCAALGAGEIIGLDRHAALEMVCAPGVLVETDKMIGRRAGKIAVSGAAGFAKLSSEASKVLNVGVSE